VRRAEEAIARFENLKIRNEEFESARADLLGQGDLVRQEIESIRTSGRFLAPIELSSLVFEWLDATPLARDALEPTEREGVFNLRLSPGLNGRVEEWMRKNRGYDPLVSSLLTKLHNDHHGWVTFDNEVAQRTPNLPFIDGTHPVVRLALLDSVESVATDPFRRACAVSLPTPRHVNAFAIFIYRLRLTGFDPRVELVPIAVDCETVEPLDIGEDTFGELTSATKGAIPGHLDLDRMQTLEQAAFTVADARRASLLQYTRDMQKARLVSRHATITRSYSVRISRARELSSQVSDQRIKRLHDGHARSLEAALQAKLDEIEGAVEPEAGLDLLSVAVVST
jgi:hypothetical protein